MPSSSHGPQQAVVATKLRHYLLYISQIFPKTKENYCKKGIYDPEMILFNFQGWPYLPCQSAFCDRHWVIWADRRVRRLQRQMPHLRKVYHIRLSLRQRYNTLKHGSRFRKFISKLEAKYPSVRWVGVLHRGNKADHVHLACTSHETIDAKTINKFWQSHCPVKEGYKACHTYMKFHNNLDALIRYMFFGRKDQPRKYPPWKAMKIKSPILRQSKKKTRQ